MNHWIRSSVLFAVGAVVVLGGCTRGETTPAQGVGGAAGASTGGGMGVSGTSGGAGGMTVGAAGSAGAAGSTESGGSAGDGGDAGGVGSSISTGPCDIYQSGNTPCVAAHSTVRALYASYAGNLYQVRRADNATQDIPVLTPGGVANSSVQDSFCSGTTCTISIIYDQSPQGNDLRVSPVVAQLNDPKEAPASAAKFIVGGHPVYGVFVAAVSGTAYRNNVTKGIATGDEPEAMYMVVDGTRYNSGCCFDYGNAETTGNDDGNGTMEAVYWGSDTTWGGTGQGTGPWIAGDLEEGMFKCDKGHPLTNLIVSEACPTALAQSITAEFATLMLKGPSGNHFTLKSSNAQSGTLTTQWDGARPSNGYSPKKLEGAIILGTGGDGSPWGEGTFFEGCMTAGVPSDAIDAAVQANIVAAGYARDEPSGVLLYADTGYEGTASQLLPKGTYTAAQLAAEGVPDNWASSIRIPNGWTVTLYSDDDFGGTSWTLSWDTPDFSSLSPSANDQVSSCKIQ